MLWYERQVVNGEEVLVPQLVLPAGTPTVSPGTISAIDNLVLIATGDVTNSGTLQAGGALVIEGANVRNTSVMSAGGTLAIVAETFTNERQTVLASENGHTVRRLEAVPVLAASDILITTQQDLINLGGQIIGSDRVRLQSLHGDIKNLAAAEDFTTVFTSTKKGLFSSKTTTTVNVGTRYYPGEILSGGDVEIT